MNQLDAINIYLRVAELASFTEAADSLGMAKANVSTAVQQLEAMLGTRLLHRTTRRVQMTNDGQAFYERSKDLLADFDELKTLFKDQQQLRGRLRVDMPTAMARGLVIPALPQFLREHPHLEIELSSTDRRVDVVREGFDCVVRVGTLNDSSLVARPLGEYQLVNCVSPGYIEAYGIPQTLDDLAHHKLVHYVSVLGGKSHGFEYLDELTSVTKYIEMKGAVIVNNADAYLSACLAGLGIIQVPENGATAKPYLDSGELIEILPTYRSAPMPVSMLYANRRHLPKRVRAFMNWMIEILKPTLS